MAKKASQKKARERATGRSVAKVPAKKTAHARPAQPDALQISGRVLSFRKNHHDDVDGLILRDGVQIRFPPHVGPAVQAVIQEGSKVSIQGHPHLTPRGDRHVHADTIEHIKSGQIIRVHESHHGKHAKKHAKKHGKKKHHRPGEESPHEQMLAEIRAIRVLLDKGEPKRRHPDQPPHERVLAALRGLRKELQRHA